VTVTVTSSSNITKPAEEFSITPYASPDGAHCYQQHAHRPAVRLGRSTVSGAPGRRWSIVVTVVVVHRRLADNVPRWKELGVTVALRGLVGRGLVGRAPRNLGVGAAYFVSAKLAWLIAMVGDGQVVPLWLPSGVALACLLVYGPTCWPGIMIGAVLANLATGPTLAAVVVISIGATLAPLLSWFLLTRVGFRTELDRFRDAVALVLLGSKAGMLVNATVGSVTLLVSGTMGPNLFWGTWLVWWFADAMGVVVVTPLLLMLARVSGWHFPARPRRLLEAIALPLVMTAAMAVVAVSSMPVFFLAFPVIVWAALRFQLRGATPCVLIVSVIACCAAMRGMGPFAGMELVLKLVTLHALDASVALTGLLLSVVVVERAQALHAVERAVEQLTDTVATLEPYRLLHGGALDGIPRSRGAEDR
jgi:integral membrane sensor domain MASE1